MNIDTLAADVAAASAAYLFNVLPEILKLPAAEQYERLRLHMEAAFLAYRHGQEGWELPTFSQN